MDKCGKKVSRGYPCWRVPSPGFYKINCSTTSEVGNNRVSIGVVIHDESGSVMAFCCQILDANFDSIVAEIMTIFKGILFSKDCGLAHCVLESNKAGAIARVPNNNLQNASYGSIISDTADLRSQSIGLSICAIPCSANRVA
ncbi:hypothetical protein LWI29_006065 [Acer saccharum]|uniref:RNase H type-1 domain-containing protein n=1 Tax=Acer saccharum TaxID=4024 RepID=A0AA39TDH9_ACESA|nr:hypothetical protein LWI29_006065 [Acer saccharum]